MKPVGLRGLEVLQAQARVVALLREDELLGLAVETIVRVGKEVAPLSPHRPERAQLTHSVLHRYRGAYTPV